MSKNPYKEKIGQRVPDNELVKEVIEAQTAGSTDLRASRIESRRVSLPNVVDEEKYYGDFYDNVKPDIKKLSGVLSRIIAFNGDTFDRWRNNQDLVLLKKDIYSFPSSTVVSKTITNYNGRGCIIYIDGTQMQVGDEITITVEGREVITGFYYNILITPLLTTPLLYILKIYPGLNPITGFVSNDILPRNWRVSVAHTSINPIEYGISASMIL